MASLAIVSYASGMPDEKRVALVTGGAKRVGRAIVERLADAGFSIAFTYLGSEAEATALCDLLRSRNTQCISIRADLTQPEAAVHAIDSAFTGCFDRLDVLINNASLYEQSDLTRVSVEQAQRLWAIHVLGPMLLCRAFEKRLRTWSGHVINMVDLLAERPWPQYLAYCASKAGLWNLTLGLARELAPQVTVNGIAPGVVEWPENHPAQEKAKYLKRVPLQRPGTPAEVANTVHFLCTAGSYITGQIIRLDGGRSIT